jgi:hypothetical protein
MRKPKTKIKKEKKTKRAAVARFKLTCRQDQAQSLDEKRHIPHQEVRAGRRLAGRPWCQADHANVKGGNDHVVVLAGGVARTAPMAQGQASRDPGRFGRSKSGCSSGVGSFKPAALGFSGAD